MTQTSSSDLNILDECKNYFELMLYQFPEVWKEHPLTYLTESYEYTGILYDKNNLNIIFDVIPGSPAEKAGIQKGDKIVSINKDKIPTKYQDILDYRYYGGLLNSNNYSSYIKYSEKTGAGFRYLAIHPERRKPPG